MSTLTRRGACGLMAAALLVWASAGAKAEPAQAPPQARSNAGAAPAASKPAAVVPPDYVIGPDDVLAVSFWGERDLSGDVVVRPDGKITVPLLNDVQASGLTPEQLRAQLMEAARRFVEDPNATVVVRQINSRKVFITGQVARPGPYPLTTPMTVLQLIATSGGLNEFADHKHIAVMRTDGGRTVVFDFNYREVMQRRNLGQNILLRPGDTVIVP